MWVCVRKKSEDETERAKEGERDLFNSRGDGGGGGGDSFFFFSFRFQERDDRWKERL